VPACLAPSAALFEVVSRGLQVLSALGGRRLVVGTAEPVHDAAGPARKALRQLAVDLGVAHRVIILDPLSDAVIHDVTGLLVPRNDPRALTLALKVLQSETFRRDGMAAAGRTHARSRYSWDRIAVDAESAYRQVARTPI
jgi:hypothetical protein